MAFLVIGGSGFIGRQAVARLAAAGEEVVAIHRGRSTPPALSAVRWTVADRNDPAVLQAIVAEQRVTAVVDMIAMTRGTTEPVLAALAGRIGRYILVSSADVYRNYGGLLGLEEAVPETAPLTENSPLRVSRHPFRRDAAEAPEGSRSFLEEYDKIPIEAAVRESGGFDWTILRLPMVYGPGDRQRRFAERVWLLKEGRPAFPSDPRVAAWRTSYAHVADVGEAIALAARQERAAGRVYNVAQEEAPTEGEWVTKLAAAMGVAAQPAAFESVPADDPASRFDPRFPLALDSSRIRAELGFHEVTDEPAGLAATIADEIARGRPATLDR